MHVPYGKTPRMRCWHDANGHVMFTACSYHAYECRQITKDTLSVLMADELVAVNQDPLGVPGDLIWKQGSDEVSFPAGSSVMRSSAIPACMQPVPSLLADSGGLVTLLLDLHHTLWAAMGYASRIPPPLQHKHKWQIGYLHASERSCRYVQICGVALKSATCAVAMLNCYSDEDPLFDNCSITLQALNRNRTYRLRDLCLTLQIWGTALKGGARAVAMLNRHFDEDPLFDNSSITLQWHHLGWEMDMPVSIAHF